MSNLYYIETVNCKACVLLTGEHRIELIHTFSPLGHPIYNQLECDIIKVAATSAKE